MRFYILQHGVYVLMKLHIQLEIRWHLSQYFQFEIIRAIREPHTEIVFRLNAFDT